MNEPSLLALKRKEFHRALMAGPLSVSPAGVVSVADKSSRMSRDIAKFLAERIGLLRVVAKDKGQTSGNGFERIVASFLRESFLKLQHLRPGKFKVRDANSDSLGSIAECEQYQHLARLAALLKERPELAADLGGDYLVKPDIVITRGAETDNEINREGAIVDESNARLAPLRAENNPEPALLLHASISCKWTIRSDRVQNSRSEALNLIRNRKGRVPHIVAVTAEPTPLRLVSLALGESDLDCVYHIALPELCEAVDQAAGRTAKDHIQALKMLVEGRRLRDISDLPLDLAV